MYTWTRLVLAFVGVVPLAGCAASGNAQPPGDGLAPPVVRAAECRWRTAPIKIDGVLNEVAWDRAQLLKDFAVFWQKRKAKTATRARLLWDRNYLYFCADMEDHDLYADVKEFNGMTWTNDVFELFFKPSADKLAYYEFQVNAANTQLELFLPSRGAGGFQRFAPLTRLGMESEVHLQGTLNDWQDRDTGWTVEGRIPWTAFKATGGRPKEGEKWRFALCRYDYSVTLDRPELSSTAPLTQPEFHRYEDYGELTFVGPPN
jgi:Carbohydrate family 9 binding domain-like